MIDISTNILSPNFNCLNNTIIIGFTYGFIVLTDADSIKSPITSANSYLLLLYTLLNGNWLRASK